MKIPCPWLRMATALAALLATQANAQEKSIMPSPSPSIRSGARCELPKTDAELRKLLTPEQYRIMRENGTEMPFHNDYWNEKRPGIYVDRISGEPLFSSRDKFDSGSGWPSFTRPIQTDLLKEKRDVSHGMVRIEIRSKASDSHLGHVFDDGPAPTGMRYCINSASLRFIPLERLEQEGYGDLVPLFAGGGEKSGSGKK